MTLLKYIFFSKWNIGVAILYCKVSVSPRRWRMTRPDGQEGRRIAFQTKLWRPTTTISEMVSDTVQIADCRVHRALTISCTSIEVNIIFNGKDRENAFFLCSASFFILVNRHFTIKARSRSPIKALVCWDCSQPWTIVRFDFCFSDGHTHCRSERVGNDKWSSAQTPLRLHSTPHPRSVRSSLAAAIPTSWLCSLFAFVALERGSFAQPKA